MTALAISFVAATTQALEGKDVIDLSGQWAFETDEADAGIDERWYKRGLAETIQLPGSMPEQRKGKPVGYDTQFTDNQWKTYPEGQTWADDPNYQPFLKEDEFRFPFWLVSDFHYVGPAWYQKEVDVPQDWLGSDIELFLERPHWETQVWVNDTRVGQHAGLGVPHRYDLAKVLKPGKNTITIRIDNRLRDINVGIDAHSISDNTQSNWNGIIGKLQLVRSAPVSVANVSIFPDIPAKSVKLKVELNNITGQAQAGKLKVWAKTIEPAPVQTIAAM